MLKFSDNTYEAMMKALSAIEDWAKKIDDEKEITSITQHSKQFGGKSIHRQLYMKRKNDPALRKGENDDDETTTSEDDKDNNKKK